MCFCIRFWTWCRWFKTWWRPAKLKYVIFSALVEDVWRITYGLVSCLRTQFHIMVCHGLSWFINVHHPFLHGGNGASTIAWDKASRGRLRFDPIDVRSLWFSATLWRHPNVPCRRVKSFFAKSKCTYWVKVVGRCLADFGIARWRIHRQV